MARGDATTGGGTIVLASAFVYYYAWRNSPKRETLYKRTCRVVARGRMNSCLIEFENGQRECVSRNAIRKRIATNQTGCVVP